jgi:hypothetical protein
MSYPFSQLVSVYSPFLAAYIACFPLLTPYEYPLGQAGAGGSRHTRKCENKQVSRHIISSVLLTEPEPRVQEPFDVLPSLDGREDVYCEHCNENPVYVFPEKELHGLSPSFHIHVNVSDLRISSFGPHSFLPQNRQPIVGIYKSLTDT